MTCAYARQSPEPRRPWWCSCFDHGEWSNTNCAAPLDSTSPDALSINQNSMLDGVPSGLAVSVPLSTFGSAIWLFTNTALEKEQKPGGIPFAIPPHATCTLPTVRATDAPWVRTALTVIEFGTATELLLKS